MIDTVLFDFDGTIMDTNEVIIQSWQETFWQLEGREEDREVLLQTFGEPLEGTMRDFFPDKPLEEALEIYRSLQRTNYLPNIHLFPGIRELLDELLQRGIKMALVTSRKRHSTDQTLKVFDLGKYFDCVVTADDVTWRKPNPQSVEIALEKTGATAAHAILIGDTKHDIQCAHNAGVPAVLVSWSLALSKELRDGFLPEYTPDVIIDHPSQVLELLQR